MGGRTFDQLVVVILQRSSLSSHSDSRVAVLSAGPYTLLRRDRASLSEQTPGDALKTELGIEEGR